MTIAEMHSLADLLIDKANAPWFSPDEKDTFINLAINEYTKNKYRAYETNEKVREDLLSLVSDITLFGATDTINLNTVTDFLFVLRLDADFANSPCGNLTNIAITPMQHDDFVESQRDPFNKATDKYPQYTQYVSGGNRIIKVASETTPTQLRMVYLKQPVEVDILIPTDSNLPQHTHEEIVNLAVRKMLATIEGFENYQVQINEIKNQE